MDHPPAGGFASIILGGKAVRRGPPALIEQSDALRGSPYLYDVGNVRYIVIADDQDWAAAALAQLP